jgi:hypothetical protein
MGTIGCPETSVNNYNYSLRNSSPEQSESLLQLLLLRWQSFSDSLKTKKKEKKKVRLCIDKIRPNFEGVYLAMRKCWVGNCCVGKNAVLAKGGISHGFDRIWIPDYSVHTDSAVTVPSLKGRTSSVPQSKKRISCASQDICFMCIIQEQPTSRTDRKANPQ